MATGYFAALMTGMYRETKDGRQVTARSVVPFSRRRWLLVEADARPRVERRFKLGHVMAMLALGISVGWAPGEPSWTGRLVLAIVVSLTASWLAHVWTTAGLPAYDGDESTLLPVRDDQLQDRQVQVMGTRTIVGFLILSLILAIPQGIVAVLEGAWWAWLGLVMFGSAGVVFIRLLLRLRRIEHRQGASA